MLKKSLLGIALVVSVFSSANAQVREDSTKEVGQFERGFAIHYPSGRQDHFVYVFKGLVKAHMRQDGESSSFTHPLDTRRCTYGVGGKIERIGYFVIGTGEHIPYAPVKEVYDVGKRNVKDRSTISNMIGKHSPCNSYVADFTNQATAMSARVAAELKTYTDDDVVAKGVADIIKELSAELTPGAKIVVKPRP